MAPHRRGTWIALLGLVAAGVVINLPALRGPLALDDYAQRAMLDGTLAPRRSALNLYDFVSDTNRAALLDRGAVPWWTDSRLSIRFLRPLSSAFVWLDHRLFGYQAFYPHVVSFIFFACAVLAAHSVYRTAISPRPAFIAVTIFALSPAHSIPLVWLANRDILLSLATGAAALSLYVRWRANRRRAFGVASAVAFGAATLTGEYAVCLAAYVLAIELCRQAEPIRRRLTGLGPFAIPFLVYASVHFLLGYGARASGFYRDPFAAPAAFARALPRAFALLLSLSWLGVDEPFWAGVSPYILGLVATGILGVLASVVWWAHRTPTEWREMGWLLLGSVLALCPLAATEPIPRILGMAALGVSAAVAVIVEAAWRTVERKQRSTKAIAVVCAALALGYVHLVRGPLGAHRLARQAVEDELWYERRLADSAVLKHPNLPSTTVLVIRANYPSTVLWAPFMLRDAAPKHWWVLSQTFEQVTAIRTGPNSLDLIQDEGPLFATGPNDFFRTAPQVVGEFAELPGLGATVARVDAEGRPKVVHFELDRDLDDPSVTWIVEGRSGFTEVIPPRVGFGVHLAP